MGQKDDGTFETNLTDCESGLSRDICNLIDTMIEQRVDFNNIAITNAENRIQTVLNSVPNLERDIRLQLHAPDERQRSDLAADAIANIIRRNLYNPIAGMFLQELYSVLELANVLTPLLRRLGGELALFQGDLALAETRLRASLDDSPDDAWTRRLLASVLQKRQAYKEAASQMLSVEKFFRDDDTFYRDYINLISRIELTQDSTAPIFSYLRHRSSYIVMVYEHVDQFVYWSRVAQALDMKFILVSCVECGIDPNEYLAYDSNITIVEKNSLGKISGTAYIIVPSLELEDFIYDVIGPCCSEPVYIHVMGNNINEGGKGRRARRRPDNLVACDVQSGEYWIRQGTSNVIYLYPFSAFDLYEYTPIDHDLPPAINCYIQDYFNPHSLNTRHARVFYETIVEYFRDRIEFNVFGSSNPHGVLTPNEYGLFNSGTISDAQKIRWQADAIKKSCMTIHIKRWEGFGYNVMKSLSVGRPIIGMRHLIYDKTIAGFCLDGYTALLGEQEYIDELIHKIAYMLDNRDLLNELSYNSARHVRNMCNFERDCSRLASFFAKCKLRSQ